jgi:histidyl-tRNA synthetase
VHRLNGEKEDAEIALRFDLTVPLARYVAQYESHLKFPFKRCHIDKVWRGERAQTGRAREFYQADVDIIGREKLPLFADVEVIFTIFTALTKIDFGEFVIHLNNKKILIGFLHAIGIEEIKHQAVISLIDKKDKLKNAKKDIQPMFLELISENQTREVMKFIEVEEKTYEEKIVFLRTYDHAMLMEGIKELVYVYSKLCEL